MHEARASVLQEVLDKHHRALSDELAPLLDSAVHAERTKAAEALNQALRRIRQSPSQSSVLDVLRSAAAAYASHAVVAMVDRSQDTLTARIIADDAPPAFEIDNAPALRAVIETKDPVVTFPTPAELGAAISSLLTAAEGKAYLFPITIRQEVTAMLIVAGGVAPAPSELLCEAAGLKLETLTVPPASPAPGIIQIAQRDVPVSETSGPRSWTDLSAEDQRLHLQAQRVARVKVAQMRLDHADALRRGAFEGNLYSALRAEIDSARAEFLQSFLAKSATMVDYLHLEIMRSLAHDDDRLLGKEYPGPMV